MCVAGCRADARADGHAGRSSARALPAPPVAHALLALVSVAPGGGQARACAPAPPPHAPHTNRVPRPPTELTPAMPARPGPRALPHGRATVGLQRPRARAGACAYQSTTSRSSARARAARLFRSRRLRSRTAQTWTRRLRATGSAISSWSASPSDFASSTRRTYPSPGARPRAHARRLAPAPASACATRAGWATLATRTRRLRRTGAWRLTADRTTRSSCRARGWRRTSPCACAAAPVPLAHRAAGLQVHAC
jgi:hypothetical protein